MILIYQATPNYKMVPPHISKVLPLIFLHIIVCNFVGTTKALQPTFMLKQCISTTSNYTLNGAYKQNLDTLLTSLTAHSSSSAFYNTSNGENLDKVYGLYYCRGDVDQLLCHNCVQSAAQQITELCTYQKEAIIFYYECTVRYANRYIFSQDEEYPWVTLTSYGNVSNPKELEQKLGSTVVGLIKNVAYNISYHGFGTKEVGLSGNLTLYCLVQCTPDILGLPCDRCLTISLGDTKESCCNGGRRQVLILRPSCMLIYDTAPFYSTQPPPLPPQSVQPPVCSDNLIPQDCSLFVSRHID